MIRFDEVPIGRRFKSDGVEYLKTHHVDFWGVDDHIYFNATCKYEDEYCYFSDNEMVELVDKCSNCKHNSLDTEDNKAYCNKLDKYIMSKENDLFNVAGLNQDPETFWCSEGELE